MDKRLFDEMIVFCKYILPDVHSIIVRLTGYTTEQTVGQRVMGHGSNGSTNVTGSGGSRVSTAKHLTHD